MVRVQFSISAILSEPPAVPELHGPDGLEQSKGVQHDLMLSSVATQGKYDFPPLCPQATKILSLVLHSDVFLCQAYSG